jgi:transcriptional regulator with XRE-family HTH domain
MTEIRPPAIRRELGDFLRTRRERLRPEDVGLRTTDRRRTPGLRREEVAVLAGVGLTWYTWLEQGRPINASGQVLEAVARALQLDDTEQRHLRRIAGLPAAPVERAGTDPGLTAAIQPVLDKLDPYPACMQTASYDVVAYNRAYRFLFTDLDRIAPAERNCATRFFTDPDWRKGYVDADVVASKMVAGLRTVAGAGVEHPATSALVDELLRRSEEFARLWSRHDVLRQEYETKRLVNPLVGELQLRFVTSQLADTGQRMTVMAPADETTAQRLADLAELTALDGAVDAAAETHAASASRGF